MKQLQSAFLTLDKNDFLKGLVVAILAAVLTSLANLFNAPGFAFGGINWSQVATIALMSGISYLSKNLLTTQTGSFLGVTKTA